LELARKLAVLVVDDCPDTTLSLSMLLETWGHAPAVAHDGHDCLRQCAERCPDVVLLDVAMPRMTGWEVARKLRDGDGTKGVFVVAMSGYGQAEDHERSRAAGCDLHLLKPLDLDVLETLLNARRELLRAAR